MDKQPSRTRKGIEAEAKNSTELRREPPETTGSKGHLGQRPVLRQSTGPKHERMVSSFAEMACYALLSTLSLFAAILVGRYLLDEAPQFTSSLDLDRGYYFLLVILGLSSAAFLFGLMKSTAAVRGNHLGFSFQVGGPAALASLVVFGGFFLTKPPAKFDLTIRLQGKFASDVGKDGWLVVDIGTRRDRHPIDQLGEVTIKELLSENEGSPMQVTLESKRFSLVASQNTIRIPASHVLSLAVGPIESLANDIVSEQYVRLVGAVEVPIIVQLQTAGGPYCNSERCQIGNSDDNAGTKPVDYDVQSGGISRNLADFWKQQWPFRDALPLGLPLWRQVAADGNIGLTLLAQVDRHESECLALALHSEEDRYTASNCPIDTEGSLRFSRKIGYLFWVLENNSDRTIENARISFELVHQTTKADDYVAASLAEPVKNADMTSKVLPTLAAHKKVIALLSAYLRSSDGFEAVLLSDTLIPRSVAYSYIEDGAKVSTIHTVRPPLRGQAATVSLPFGWYEQ